MQDDVTGSQPSPVDDDVRALWQDPSWGKGDVGNGRQGHRGAQQGCRRGVAEGSVCRQCRGEAAQAFPVVDCIVEPGEEVMAQPDECRTA